MKIIVVGNGMHTGYRGHLIDRYDVVVRLSSYVLSGYGHVVGAKTDILSLARIEPHDPMPPIQWAGNPYGLSAMPTAEVHRHHPRLVVAPYEAICGAYAAIGEQPGRASAHPTLGLLTIYQAIATGRHYSDEPVTITGFDFSHTGWPRYYWDATPQKPIPATMHRMAAERTAIKNLVATGEVRFLYPRDIWLMEELAEDHRPPMVEGKLT